MREASEAFRSSRRVHKFNCDLLINTFTLMDLTTEMMLNVRLASTAKAPSSYQL